MSSKIKRAEQNLQLFFCLIVKPDCRRYCTATQHSESQLLTKSCVSTLHILKRVPVICATLLASVGSISNSSHLRLYIEHSMSANATLSCILSSLCMYIGNQQDRSFPFRTYVFHPCKFILAFFILAYSIPSMSSSSSTTVGLMPVGV